ncbi:MAG: hypothetical protein CMH31_05805 [Micavibrio sp.]|nr:hypothetical protein [Micavibrio sp.]
MKYLFNVKIFFTLVLLSLTFQGSNSHAQTITENQPLDFGRFVLVDNAAPRRIRLLPSCSFNADPEYLFFTDPQCGSYTITGQAPNTTLTVNITTTTMTNGGGANFVTLSTFTRPNMVRTDALGEVTFEIGATMDSDGGGSTHIDGAYNGTYTITVTP